MTFADIANGERIARLTDRSRATHFAEPGYLYIDDQRHPRAIFEHEFELQADEILNTA